jgi:hypothetical protein
MSKIMTWCTGLALVGALAGCGQSAAAVQAATGTWRPAIEVPGLGALNKGAAEVTSVSCGSAGNCVAGGAYRGHSYREGFVAVERRGVWRRAIEVPGLAALNKGRKEYDTVGVVSVSCATAGNCAVGGDYEDPAGRGQGFVAVERNGVWRRAIEVPGLRALNMGFAEVNSVTCASAGNCAVGGDYVDRSGNGQGFVAVERNGVWRKAIEVPGLGELNRGGSAEVSEVSCASAGNCAAGGGYEDRGQNGQGFVVAERNGHWGKAIEVPGLGTLNRGGYADVSSVSCASAGNCAAGGGYEDRGQNGQGFVAVEKNGRWGKALDPPGLKALNESAGSPNAEVDSMSCASAGNCAAVGTYGEPYGAGFVVSEKKGVWGKAIDVGLVGGRIAGANSVSCASAGNCAAGGFYSDSSGGVTQGWVALERRGHWGNGVKVPGLAALNKGGDAAVYSVSCPSAGHCAAGGYYTGRHQHSQGFVLSQTG